MSLRIVATTSTAASAVRRARYGRSRSVSSSHHCRSSRTTTMGRLRAASRSSPERAAKARSRSWAVMTESFAHRVARAANGPESWSSGPNGRKRSSCAHSVMKTCTAARRATSAKRRMSAVFPMPASPDTRANRSRLRAQSVRASSRRRNSARRPMKVRDRAFIERSFRGPLPRANASAGVW